jgi:hypothetical protein
MWADWSGTDELAVVRDLGHGAQQIEFPLGHPTAIAKGLAVAYPRVSPRGDRLAYFEYATPSQLASLIVITRDGTRATLARNLIWPMGIAWEHDGSAVWFAAADGDGSSSVRVTNLASASSIAHRAT